ncbi:unnamed protein product [Bemisia tabaci]|uniref:leucine--tRNA ligase n=1 Tax=Bemisia tabaci TaxID=7038 RepID=A0A9N9ZZK5_BEMTA|nr:unnamed protein product [Bemisia tabaci]
MKTRNVFHWLSNKQVLSVGLSSATQRHFSDNIWAQKLDVQLMKEIESRWSKKVNSRQLDGKNEAKDKYYILPMFPYSSGDFHMGHIRTYVISDTLSRFHQMTGKNVLQPIGWDAFGLPAENASIERHIPVDKWAKSDVENMKSQLQSFRFNFDWDLEINTCFPNYYRWTQHIFLKLFHAGLVYQKEALVNWDPLDETALSDEQVDEDGKSWRTGVKVEKKILKQWFVKTTAFAKSLYDGLDETVLNKANDVHVMQRDWIGECDGYSFNFNLVSGNHKMQKFITVWTRHPEHLNNIQYLTVLPGSMLDHMEPTQDWNKNRRLSIQAANPINGSTIPIFVNDTVTYEECQDVKAGIPEIFLEDHVFAQENEIEIKKIDPVFSTKEEICNYAMEKNIGGYPVSSKLKDWLISRQRYWGTPIPLVFCSNCVGPQPIPYDLLPVRLPHTNKINMNTRAITPLESASSWVRTKCPSCGGPAKRVTDTMDTFFDSSWYYLRYLDVSNEKVPFDPKVVQSLLPVDVYVCSKEHAILHLYYARFMSHFLHSIGWVPNKEPFQKLLTPGKLKAKTYKFERSGDYVKKSEVKVAGPGSGPGQLHGYHKASNEKVKIDWEEMSESKRNSVDPAQVVAEYGIDTTRLMVLYYSAPTHDKLWITGEFKSILDWQRKAWQIVKNFMRIRDRQTPVRSIDEAKLPMDEEMMYNERNSFIKSVWHLYSELHLFNTIISKFHKMFTLLSNCSNASIRSGKEFERALAEMIILMAPMAPHFAAQLWQGIALVPYRLNENEFNWSGTVFEQKWPVVDDNFPMYLIVQVDNDMKHRFTITNAELRLITKEQAIEKAKSLPRLQEILTVAEVLGTSYHAIENSDHTINFKTKFSHRRSESESIKQS